MVSKFKLNPFPNIHCTRHTKVMNDCKFMDADVAWILDDS
jgi:hypothetical protein